MRIHLFLLPLSILLLFGCQKKIATEKLPANQLVFGSGGGFVGTEYTYSLLEDGRIVAFQKDSAKQKIVERIGKSKAASQFSMVDSMKLPSRLYNVPANIYHFIIIRRDGKKENRLVWDAANPVADLEQFYKQLSSFLPKTK